MEKSGKVVATVIAVLVFIVLFAIVCGVSGDAGRSTPGFIGIVLTVAVVYAVRAIWKKDNNNDGNGNNSSTLQK